MVPSSLVAPKLLSSCKEAAMMCSGGGSIVARNVSTLECMLRTCMSHLCDKFEHEEQQQRKRNERSVRTFEASIQKAGSGEAQAQREQETLSTQMMNTV